MTKASGTYNTNPATTYNTVTSYKNQFGNISAVLNTAFTRSSDTGQVTFSSLSTSSAGLQRDYEVFALTDSLQATKPLYLRLDYTSWTAANYSGLIMATVGTTSDGAGNVSGTGISGFQVLQNYSTSTSLTRSVYASTDGSYWMFVIGVTSFATVGFDKYEPIGAMVIERTRDADGTPNGNGFTIWRWSQNADSPQTLSTPTFAGMSARTFDTTAGQPLTGYDPNILIPGYGQSQGLLTGSTAPAYPAYTAAGYLPQGASKALMFAGQYDHPSKVATSVTHYGTTMQFLPMGPQVVVYAGYLLTVSTTNIRQLSPLFRWE